MIWIEPKNSESRFSDSAWSGPIRVHALLSLPGFSYEFSWLVAEERMPQAFDGWSAHLFHSPFW